MSPAIKSIKWECIGATITGASHTGRNLPRQDSFQCWPEGLRASTDLYTAVGDGHGDTLLHSQSKIGSRVAVELGIRNLRGLVRELKTHDLSKSTFNELSEKRAESICRCWTERVSKYAACESLPGRIKEALSDEQRELLQKSPSVSFGTTLLCAAVTKGFAAFHRIGDGVIATVSDTGEVDLPFNEQEKTSQRTASLCSTNAAKKMEYRLLDFSRTLPPSLIVVATDGYPDAVGSIESFLERIRIFWKMLRGEGIEHFSESLRRHLDSARAKLFDDTTLAFIVRDDWLRTAGGTSQ